MKKTFLGETFEQALPAYEVKIKEFEGVLVCRIAGSKEQIGEVTEFIDAQFTKLEKTVLCDAIWLGQIKLDDEWQDLYELIIMIKLPRD